MSGGPVRFYCTVLSPFLLLPVAFSRKLTEVVISMQEVSWGMLSGSILQGRGKEQDGAEEDVGLCCTCKDSAELILWGFGGVMALARGPC